MTGLLRTHANAWHALGTDLLRKVYFDGDVKTTLALSSSVRPDGWIDTRCVMSEEKGG